MAQHAFLKTAVAYVDANETITLLSQKLFLHVNVSVCICSNIRQARTHMNEFAPAKAYVLRRNVTIEGPSGKEGDEVHKGGLDELQHLLESARE